MSPQQKSLRALISKPFSHDHLSEVEAALSELAVETAGERVACFVVRKVCAEICNNIDANEPTTSTKHDAIQAHIQPALNSILDALASGIAPSFEQLAKLIDESKHVRTRMLAA